MSEIKRNKDKTLTETVNFNQAHKTSRSLQMKEIL